MSSIHSQGQTSPVCRAGRSRERPIGSDQELVAGVGAWQLGDGASTGNFHVEKWAGCP